MTRECSLGGAKSCPELSSKVAAAGTFNKLWLNGKGHDVRHRHFFGLVLYSRVFVLIGNVYQ